MYRKFTAKVVSLCTLLGATACMTQEESIVAEELGTVTGDATEACSRKIAQQAAHYGAIDVRSFVVGRAQRLPDSRHVIQLLVTINYSRKAGVEKRTALIECTVTQYGHVAIAEAKR